MGWKTLAASLSKFLGREVQKDNDKLGRKMKQNPATREGNPRITKKKGAEWK